MKTKLKKLISIFDIYFLFMVFILFVLYFMYDDKSYCLDTGFRAGDPMCQTDENNKLVIVKE